MAIDVLNTGTAAGSGDGESLRSAMTKVNSNFGVAENAASKIVQASSADTTSNKVMLTDHAWRGAQLGDYFTYGGTANAITLTSANLKAGGTLIKGMKFRFEATATNTGATTIAVDGGSAIACVTPTGVALPAGFIRTDVFTECEYDGSSFVVSRKVESGSNASGEWTKWEDGIQICRVGDQIQGGTSSFTITYPIAFYITSSNRRVATREIVNSIDFGNTIYDGTDDAASSVASHGGSIIYEASNTISPFNDRVSVALSGLQANTSRYSDYSATITGRWY